MSARAPRPRRGLTAPGARHRQAGEKPPPRRQRMDWQERGGRQRAGRGCRSASVTPSRTSGTPPEPGVAWCTSSPPARFPTLLVVSPPWGDMSVPAFTVLSHTCTWHSHTRRWRAQPPVPATDPHSPRLSGLELSDTAGHGAPVGNAEWVWQLWPCFPREVVADSDCQSHQPWVPRAYWQRVKLALLWLFPLRPCRMAPGAWGTAGGGGCCTWHGWEGVATGRELLPASQPGCFQSSCYSTGFSPSTLPFS